jgi:hypothetical protein
MAVRHNSYARLHRAFDREAAEAMAAEKRAQVAERQECARKRAEADANAHRDVASLEPGAFVRDRFGWHRVVRVSKKSVSVETAYTWTDRIPLEKILETRTEAES